MAMFIVIGLGIVRFYRRAKDKTDGDAGLILAFALAVLAYVVQAMVVDMAVAYYVNMVFMLAVGALFGWQESTENLSTNNGIPCVLPFSASSPLI
jgi:uncharacterized membrane protein